MLQSQLDEIIEIADAVDQTDAWKEIKSKGIFQDILQVPCEINEYFDSAAGRPDVYWVDNAGVAYIIDLKTAASADHRKFYYQALGFHYDWQLANYAMLLKQIRPEIKSVRCFNLVVGKKKNIYNVELFEYPELMIERAGAEISAVVEQIKNEKDYLKYNPSFSKPVVFGVFSENGEAVSTGDWDDGDSGDKE